MEMDAQKLIIRNCNLNDINECAKLYAEVYQEPPYNEIWDIKTASKYLKRFIEFDKNNCYIALQDNNIVGLLLGYTYPWRERINYYIQEIFVQKDSRSKGIGKSLISYAISQLGKNISISLIANQNTDAAAFYEKLGLSKHKYYKFYCGEILNKF